MYTCLSWRRRLQVSVRARACHGAPVNSALDPAAVDRSASAWPIWSLHVAVIMLGGGRAWGSRPPSAACMRMMHMLACGALLLIGAGVYLALSLVPATDILVSGVHIHVATSRVSRAWSLLLERSTGAQHHNETKVAAPVAYNLSDFGLVAPSDRFLYGAGLPTHGGKKKKNKGAASHYRIVIGILTGNSAKIGGGGSNTAAARRAAMRVMFRNVANSSTPSCPNAFDGMSASSPVALRSPRILYRFFAAGGTLSQPDDVHAIAQEAAAEKDLLIFQGLKEGYWVPGAKYLRFFHWLEEMVDAGRFTYDHMAMIDDDTFLRLPALLAGKVFFSNYLYTRSMSNYLAIDS